MEAMDGLFSATWYFADAAIFIGMAMALNADETQALVNKTVIGIQEKFVLGGKQAPQQIKRTVAGKSVMWTYSLIKNVLLFGAVFNVLNNIFLETPRNPIINVLYLYYPLLTAYVSAHDILLHEDRAIWSKELKQRHVQFPMNLEGNKILAADMTATQAELQLREPIRALQENGLMLTGLIFTVGLFYRIFPPALFFVLCPFIFMAQNKANMVFDNLFDIFAISTYRNKFEHFFGDFFGIVFKGEAHDYKGKQYQYFLYSFKPMEKMLNKMTFEKGKKQYGMNNGEALATYYIARGTLVTSLLFTLNLINTELFRDDLNKVVSLVLGLLPYVAYYGIHAYIAWSNKVKGTSAWFDEGWKKALACGGEMMLSGVLFYNPLMQLIAR